VKTLEMTKATLPLAEYAENINQEPVILTKHGKPVAALVSLEDVDTETVKLSSNPKFIALIERSRGERKAKGGISSAEMRKRLGLKK
jgi:prevent-host-death family protein